MRALSAGSRSLTPDSATTDATSKYSVLGSMTMCSETAVPRWYEWKGTSRPSGRRVPKRCKALLVGVPVRATCNNPPGTKCSPSAISIDTVKEPKSLWLRCTSSGITTVRRAKASVARPGPRSLNFCKVVKTVTGGPPPRSTRSRLTRIHHFSSCTVAACTTSAPPGICHGGRCSWSRPTNSDTAWKLCESKASRSLTTKTSDTPSSWCSRRNKYANAACTYVFPVLGA
mmetsp:Transcript_58528/g.178478  ORF Transcript_58528/g.178478 Transcript_58528/m.178478 type:complete len:229 (+) Transcript_58528:561-1247(+)